ncbi:hypothetical protein [Tardiphaga sp.]|jgi:hypothetical protein|uniref:hypothetical protein n=1 Tax=Tardiphaga sp. TaxID=1926292 RepID=UPI0037D9D9C4
MTQRSYPESPGFKVAGASQEAAEAIAPQAPRVRDRVLQCIRMLPGMTADEIAAALGLSILTVRPRVSELHRQGEIQPTGGRHRNSSGMTAGTWEVAPPLPNQHGTTT